MKTIMIVTKDVISGESTTQPMLYKNIEVAKRAWGNSIEELSKNNPTNVPITDLQLYKIGEFDTETLEIEPKVEYIACAQEFIKG